MAALPLAGRAVDAVVRIVYPVGDQLLADALAHGALVPAPLAGIEVGEQGTVWQHHLRQRQGSILADDQPAGRHRLEVLAMGFGIPGEGKLIPGGGQHAEIYGVDEQLARGTDGEIRELAAEASLIELQTQAWPDPLRRQHHAPGVGRIADAVVLELPVTDPLAPDELELQGLTAGERHLAAAVAHRRVVTGIGTRTHHLAFQGGPLRQIDIPDPSAIGGLHLHQGMLSQAIPQQARRGIIQPGQLGTAADDIGGSRRRGEVDPLFRRTIEVIGRLRQLLGRVEAERPEGLPGAISRRHRHGHAGLGLQRPDQQQALAQGGQPGLAVPFGDMGRQDLALGELNLRRQGSLQIVGRWLGIEGQGGGSLNGSQQGAARQSGHDEAG
ncbi:hypothetical protein D3C72_636700 [compost metagenome]